MGNTSYRQTGAMAPPDSRSFMQADFPKFIFGERIGNGKFLKSYQMKADGTLVVVKVYIKLADEDLALVISRLTHVSKVLSPRKYPFLLPYQMWFKSSARLTRNMLTPTYLVRQYFKSNLYDRLATRPFLNRTEKYWLIYQLLRAVEVIHEENIFHGDIKPENIMVTSWNWLIVTDFATYKPVTIPEDDPTDFQYFFESSGRRRCYIAPERFVKRVRDHRDATAENAAQGDLRLMENDGASRRWVANGAGVSGAQSAAGASDERTSRATLGGMGLDSLASMKAMDVFSLGCTIAEILMDGVPLIDLPGILKYRAALEPEADGSTDSSPKPKPSGLPTKGRFMDRLDHPLSPCAVAVQRIKNPTLREVVCRMTARNPDHRPTVSEVIDLLTSGIVVSDGIEEKPKELSDIVLAPYFGNYVYDLFLSVHWQGMLPDTRIAMLCESYNYIMTEITGAPDVDGTIFFESCYRYSGISKVNASASKIDTDTMFRMSETPARYKTSHVAPMSTHSTEAGIREDITDKIYAMGVDELLSRCEILLGLIKSPTVDDISDNSPVGSFADGSSTTCGSRAQVESFLARTSLMHPPRAAAHAEGLIVIIEFICSNIRHLRYPHSKITSLLMLLRMAASSSSQVILQRIIPFMLLSTADPVPSVRAFAVRLLCSTLSYVDIFLPHERFIFIRSIFPALNAVSKDSEIIVRIAFVECLGKFAELSKIFLDKANAIQISQLNQEDINATDESEGANEKEKLSDNDDMEKKISAIKASYASDLKELHSTVSRWVTAVLLDTQTVDNQRSGSLSTSSHASLCKKVLLSDIVRLCSFFGTDLTLDVLLSQLLTFLNDQDWELRLAFCAALPGVCAFLGETFASNFIYPCIENALVDVEVMVVSKALNTVACLIQLKLLNESLIEKTVQLFSCLVVHPTNAVRQSAVEMVNAAYAVFGPTISYAMIRPSLTPFLEYDIFSSGDPINLETIRKALKAPVSARDYRAAMLSRRNSLGAGSAVLAVSINPSRPLVRIDPSLGTVGGDASIVIVDSATNSVNTLPPPPGISAVKSSEGLASMDEAGICSVEQLEEQQLIGAMSKYIEQAAYEMNTKTLQWRNASTQSHVAHSRSPYQCLMDSPGLDAEKNNSRILDIPATGLIPESSVRRLKIPHQKLSIGIGISEDLRAHANDHIRLAEDPILIHKVFGIKTPALAESIALEIEGGQQSYADAGMIVNPSNLPGGRPMSMAVVQGISKARTLTTVGMPTIMKPSRLSATSSMTPAKELLSVAGSPVNVAPETADINVSTHVANALSELSGTDLVLKQIKALKVPPLPRELGSLRQPDGREYSMFTEQLDMSSAIDPQSRALWRPKDAVQLASLTEHSQSVTRLAVAHDQSFFVSASADKTARVWQIAGLENNAYPRSALTYAMHTGRLTDVTPIENSHSVASSCDDGSVHVWRVDVARRTLPTNSHLSSSATAASGAPVGGAANSSGFRYGLSVSGMSEIKNLSPSDGGVVCLQHFNSDSASILTFCTTRGAVKSWDLRCSNEPFEYRIPSELGYPTAMTLAPDKNWLCVGTSKGCVALWDIRYNVMSKLWQHSSASSIHRLASCKTISGGLANRANSRDYPEGAYLFVAAGRAEAAVWGLPEGGECIRCYRTVPAPPVDSANVPTFHAIDPLPILNDIPLQSRHSRYGTIGMLKKGVPCMEPSVRSIIGRISAAGASYIITAGSDRYVRFWDFSNHANCFTVSGLDSAQPRHQYATPDVPAFRKKLFLCFDTAVPSLEQTLQAHLPARENRGLISPPVGYKSGILDLKVLDLPTRMILTAGRDGEIKILK